MTSRSSAPRRRLRRSSFVIRAPVVPTDCPTSGRRNDPKWRFSTGAAPTTFGSVVRMAEPMRPDEEEREVDPAPPSLPLGIEALRQALGFPDAVDTHAPPKRERPLRASAPGRPPENVTETTAREVDEPRKEVESTPAPVWRADLNQLFLAISERL